MESPGESVGSGDVHQLRAVRLRRSAGGDQHGRARCHAVDQGHLHRQLPADAGRDPAGGGGCDAGRRRHRPHAHHHRGDGHDPGSDDHRGLRRSDDGGGILQVSSTLNLVNSAVSGNTAGFLGGGIASFSATLNLTGSTVSGNTAQLHGGGIASLGATLILSGSTVSGNTATDPDEGDGGGIEVSASTATLNASRVRGNTSGNNGAGIGQEGTGSTLTLISSTVSGNTGAGGGGGINNFGGPLALTNSSVDHNTAGSGGGIFNDSGFEDATLTINHSTVSFNRALGTDPFFGGGGGITNFAELGNTASVVATHLTMTGNTAPAGHGGAIANLGGDGTAALVTIGQS